MSVFKGGICGIVFFCLCLLGFGIFVGVQKNALDYPGGTCAAFPKNLTSFSAKKSIVSQWHWRYNFEEFDGRIEQLCPTIQHDVNVYVGNSLAARSDKKIFTLYDTNYVNDCAGNRVFTVSAGSIGQKIINGFKIVVQVLIEDTNGTIIGYSEGTHFINDDIEITSAATKAVVAKMTRSKLTLSAWEWKFTRYDVNDSASDPRILSILAGYTSFSERDSDNHDQTDMCNSFFKGAVITLIVVGVVIGLLALCMLYHVMCKRRASYQSLN